MKRTTPYREVVLNNLFWFVASFILAFFVWIIATTEADPIEERRITQQIPVLVDVDPGLMVVDQQTRNVRITLRAQQSVLSLLTTEDIVVRADLTGLGPGQHTVELESQVARRVVDVDTQPRQITVTLEQIQSQQVSVVANVLPEQQPPTGYQWSVSDLSETQVLVSGAASQVQRVIAVRAPLNLTNQRTNLETDVRLVAVDVDGNTVADVTIEPQTVNVDVEIALLEGVREVSVSANIDIDSLPDGYNLVSFTSEPATVVVSGNLSSIPEVLETEPISLENRTQNFEVTVPIVLPDGRLFILSAQQEVNVSISISPVITTRAFEEVPVEAVGLAEGLRAEVVNNQVTVLVTGAQAVIQSINEDDMRVTVDLTGLGVGAHDVVPIAFNGRVQIEADNISTTPPTITVNIVQVPEATETPAP